MNAIIFLAMTVLLPVADLIRNINQAGLLSDLVQPFIELDQKSGLLKAEVLACGIVMLLIVLIINWMLHKAASWFISKTTKVFGESVAGTAIYFCLTLLPTIWNIYFCFNSSNLFQVAFKRIFSS